MALRAVPDHPKFARLKMLLKLPKGSTLGWLESVWHFTGRFTPHGNIGKYADQEIEAWVEWDGEPGALIAALIGSQWIDKSDEHRLCVHDWHVHADNATKLSVKRSGKPFVTDSVSTVSPQCGLQVEEVATVCGLPVPEPVPEPEPEPEPVPVKEKMALVERAFVSYCTVFSKNPKTYTLTPERKKKALLRMEERLAIHGGDMGEVSAEFKRAIANLAASEFHRTKGYIDWTEQIFRSTEEFEKRINWQKPQEAGNAGNFNKSKSGQVIDDLRRSLEEDGYSFGIGEAGDTQTGEPRQGNDGPLRYGLDGDGGDGRSLGSGITLLPPAS